MLSNADVINPRFHDISKDMGYNVKPLTAEEAQAA
jgi:hypothetical protein